MSLVVAVQGRIAGSSCAGRQRETRHIVLANLARHGVDTARRAGVVAGARSGHIAVGDRQGCWRGGAEVAPGGAHVHRATRRETAVGAEALQDAVCGAAEVQARGTAARRFAWRPAVPL